MAQMVLIMGESGTGKSTSIRNCDPKTTAIVNPVGKPLPFKGKFTVLNGETESRKICKFMRNQVAEGKKLIVVDDFQYILSVPYMNRIKENGWDKWNDFGANYFEIIEVCKELPEDVVVAYMTHTETLENGITTIKLIGKLLREKITIEGLFTIVLRTGVNEGNYYFYTQNSGKDTVKSPMGMFPAYAIDNDLNYVAEKIRNFYEIGEYKSDEEMGQADSKVASNLEKPDANGRRTRTTRGTKTHDQVVKENDKKVGQYLKDIYDAIGESEEDGIDFDAASDAIDSVETPELETPPRRTRKERKAADANTNTDYEEVVLDKDTYFYVTADDNYVMKHEGETVALIKDGVELMREITQEEFRAGIKRIAQEDVSDDEVMNPPEKPKRTRRTTAQTQTGDEDAEAAQKDTEVAETATATRRTRRVREER